jgi:tetratricopeptide (TPR) repeat protein
MGHLLPGFWLLLLVAGCASNEAAVQRLRAGYDALAARQLDQALAAADEVLAGSPPDTLPAEARYLRGRVFEERAIAGIGNTAENFRVARVEYSASLNLPHKPDLEGNIRAGAANVAFHQDDYTTAMEQWSAAYEKLKRPEDKVLTLYQLGRTAQRLGRWEEADNYLASVQESAPGTELANKAHAIQGARAFTVQLATFETAKPADAAVAELRKQGVAAQHAIDPASPTRHLLRVGPLKSYGEANSIKARFAARYPGAIILP